MNEILNIYAQVLNLQWQLRAMAINQGLKILDSINEAKKFEEEYKANRERQQKQYDLIMQQRKKYESTDRS